MGRRRNWAPRWARVPRGHRIKEVKRSNRFKLLPPAICGGYTATASSPPPMNEPSQPTNAPDILERCPLLSVVAQVRPDFWRDSDVNGVDDIDGSLIPLRVGDSWAPLIELATGQIRDWPEGTIANISYKVVDMGSYWLADAEGRRMWKWADHYVPDYILCIGDHGHGDYIILRVGPTGKIVGWNPPVIDLSQWEFVGAPAAEDWDELFAEPTPTPPAPPKKEDIPRALTDEEEKRVEQIEMSLSQCTGSTSFVRWSMLFQRDFLTDGTQLLAEKLGAYWLMDIIASWQPKLKPHPFQIWFIRVCVGAARPPKPWLNLDGAEMEEGLSNTWAWVWAEDGNNKVIASQLVAYTDFLLGRVVYSTINPMHAQKQDTKVRQAMAFSLYAVRNEIGGVNIMLRSEY